MSNLLQLPDSLSVDSRLLISPSKKCQIKLGASQCTQQRQTSSSLSNNNLTFNVVLSNQATTVIDSYAYVEIGCSVTVGCIGLTGTTVKDYVDDNFALRANPLASICTQVVAQINNQTVSVETQKFYNAFAWNQNFVDSEAINQSIVPILPDGSQEYHDLNGSLRNPLLSYEGGSTQYFEPRGSLNKTFDTITNTASAWTFNFLLTSPIPHPLFEYNPTKIREGYANINLLNLQLLMNGNLSRMFSLDAINCPLVNNITVNFTSATLIMTWLTVPTTQHLPDRTLRSFSNITVKETTTAPFLPGSTAQVTAQNQNFNQIPSAIYVWVADPQPLNLVDGYKYTDSYFGISNVVGLFNNNSGLLSNYSQRELYNICSADEGSKMSYVQFSEMVGSILCLDPVKLFGLGPLQTTGQIGQFNFSLQITCTNLSTRTITPNIYIAAVLDNVLEIYRDGTALVYQGYITENDVQKALSLPAHPTNFEQSNIYGGSIGDFFGKIFGFVKPILNALKGTKAISTGLSMVPHPVAQGLSSVADIFGYANPAMGGKKTSKAEMQRYYRSLIQ